MIHVIICPNCGRPVELQITDANSDLYIPGKTYGIQCNHCFDVFETLYTGTNFITEEKTAEKKSLTKALDEAVRAAEEFEKVLKEGTVAKVSEKTNQTLMVKYYDGTECTIMYDKQVRLCVNDIFGTINVYDENDDCLFYTSKSLVKTVMLLSSDDKISTGYMPSENEVAEEE